MIPAWSYKEILNSLNSAFRDRYNIVDEKGIRMVGLLFAPPQSNLGQAEITSSLDYFHHRSGDSIDFFCGGYRRYGFDKQVGVERQVTSDDPPWYYNMMAFEELRQEIEKLSSWKYSGEADLILLTAQFDKTSEESHIDWSSAIYCDLDQMKRDNAITSVRRFFEDIFRFVDSYEGDDPVWGFSDKQGIANAGSALQRIILSLLPKNIGKIYCETKHLAVKDLAQQKNAPDQK